MISIIVWIRFNRIDSRSLVCRVMVTGQLGLGRRLTFQTRHGNRDRKQSSWCILEASAEVRCTDKFEFRRARRNLWTFKTVNFHPPMYVVRGRWGLSHTWRVHWKLGTSAIHFLIGVVQDWVSWTHMMESLGKLSSALHSPMDVVQDWLGLTHMMNPSIMASNKW